VKTTSSEVGLPSGPGDEVVSDLSNTTDARLDGSWKGRALRSSWGCRRRRRTNIENGGVVCGGRRDSLRQRWRRLEECSCACASALGRRRRRTGGRHPSLTMLSVVPSWRRRRSSIFSLGRRATIVLALPVFAADGQSATNLSFDGVKGETRRVVAPSILLRKCEEASRLCLYIGARDLQEITVNVDW